MSSWPWPGTYKSQACVYYASIIIVGGGKHQGIFQNNWIIPASIWCKITSFACSEMQNICGYVYTAETEQAFKRVENIEILQ